MNQRRPTGVSSAGRWFLVLILAFAGNCLDAGPVDSAVEDYPVPGHGWLRLLVPAEWQVQYVYVDDASTPPTFYVTPLEGSDFELTVTVYWHDGLDRNITSAEALRERVQKAGEEALQAATDQELKIKAIEGAKQPGFLYDLSDAN